MTENTDWNAFKDKLMNEMEDTNLSNKIINERKKYNTIPVQKDMQKEHKKKTRSNDKQRWIEQPERQKSRTQDGKIQEVK